LSQTSRTTKRRSISKHNAKAAKVFADKGLHSFAVFLLLRKETEEMHDGVRVQSRQHLHLTLCKQVPQICRDILYGR
jgi:hypothetical protein